MTINTQQRLDQLDQFRKLAGDIQQRFVCLQRAVAHEDQVAIRAAEQLMAQLRGALHSAPRYAVGDFLFTTRIEADDYAAKNELKVRDVTNDY